MAITINTEPNDVAPVYSDITYVVTTTNQAQPNFKFVAVIKNAAGTIIAKLKAPIFHGTTDKGVFNLSRILQNYVTYDFSQTTGTMAKCPNSYVVYTVEFGEEYGGTEYLNLASDKGPSDLGKYAWNGLFDLYGTETTATYKVDVPSSTPKFLTRVRTRRVTRAQYDYLYSLLVGFNATPKIIAYNAAGSVLATSQIKLPYSPGGSDLSDYLVRFGAGVVQLNALTSGQLDTGTAGNVIPSGTAYYTIQIQTGAGSPGSELYRFDIVEECSKYAPQYLYFLNPLGGFESVRCGMASRDKYNVSRKQFKRNNYTLSGNNYAYDTSKHGLTNYAVEKTKEITLNTNFLNETEFEWLQDLIASPVVFLGNIPVNIVETSYDVFDDIDGPNNLKITVQYTEPERLQNA
jgi:hypothetical protein